MRPVSRLPKVREPDLFIRAVDRVRARQGAGQEEGARARLVRNLLLLERLPLQPPAGEGPNRLEYDSRRGGWGGVENVYRYPAVTTPVCSPADALLGCEYGVLPILAHIVRASQLRMHSGWMFSKHNFFFL